ncbi:MAG: hypothetical protein JXA96_12665 [Sedimentisphaerales bacterium]|nr:hypothetical protein [Sedimentisphaerales bacterium]
MKILNLLIFGAFVHPCIAFNDLDSNKMFLDSIIIKANALCKNKLDTALFNTQSVSFYENGYGKLFYKSVPFANSDSTGIISFRAVKATDWKDWKIRLRTGLRKRLSRRETDSLQDWMLNNIDNMLGGFGMSKETFEQLRRLTDKDSMIVDEIKYLNPKK